MTRSMRLASGLVTAALVFAGCGTATTSAPTVTGEPGGSPGASPGSSPTGSGELPTVTLISTDEPPSLDASIDTGDPIQMVWHIQQKLTDFDPQTLEVIPALAESWTNPDPLVWEFKLRQGVSFSDGRPFTAEDVVSSFEWYGREDSRNPRGEDVNLANIEVVDDHTVRFHLTDPFPTMPIRLGNDVFIFSAAQINDAPDTIATQPLGTGPFMVDSWQKGDRMVFKPNPNYPEPPAVSLVWRWVPEASTQVAEFVSGAADILLDPPLAQLGQLDGTGSIPSVPALERWSLQINVPSRPEWQDLRVRQALNYAIDTQTIIDTVFEGRAKPLASMILSDTTSQPWPYDPDKARQLLAEAGYADGIDDVTITASDRYSAMFDALQVVAAQLTDVGVRTKLVSMAHANFSDLRTEHQIKDLGVSSSNTQYDPVLDLAVTRPANNLNISQLEVPGVESVWDQLTSETDPAKRAAGAAQINEALDEAATILELWLVNKYWAVSDRIVGFIPSADNKLQLQTITVTE